MTEPIKRSCENCGKKESTIAAPYTCYAGKSSTLTNIPPQCINWQPQASIKESEVRAVILPNMRVKGFVSVGITTNLSQNIINCWDKQEAELIASKINGCNPCNVSECDEKKLSYEQGRKQTKEEIKKLVEGIKNNSDLCIDLGTYGVLSELLARIEEMK